ncbi:MAG: cupin domain-containing protein [Oscillospiraceae bacterium]|nr:cupin domain-containing protein [Oscillospiraceae bacterium]
MLIDFPNLEETITAHMRGGEKSIAMKAAGDALARVMAARLEPGASVGEHVHTDNCEVIFIVSGSGTVLDDGVLIPIAAGQATYCPKGHRHSLMNTGAEDLVFYAVVPQQ